MTDVSDETFDKFVLYAMKINQHLNKRLERQSHLYLLLLLLRKRLIIGLIDFSYSLELRLICHFPFPV